MKHCLELIQSQSEKTQLIQKEKIHREIMKIDPQILKIFQYERSYKVEEVETEFKLQLLNPAKFKSYKNLYI